MTDSNPIQFREGEMLPGRLELPFSINTGGWSNLVIPIATVANGTGPTVLLLGGNHGDEHESELILMDLISSLDPSAVTGRLIIVPRLSIEASNADTRLWPDGTNLNRVFPGSATGSIQERIAHLLSTVLFPMADVVMDLHSGGRGTRFVPMAHMRLVADRAQRRAMLEAMLAFNTDLHMLYSDVTGVGLLVAEAERQGKLVVSTELGGGGIVSKESVGHRAAWAHELPAAPRRARRARGDPGVTGAAAGRARVRARRAPLRPGADLRHGRAVRGTR